jgi:hypothetical protein
MPSLMKYFDEQDDTTHPGQLGWPGTEGGYPVMGPPSTLTDNEYQEIEHAAFYNFRVFDINDEKDRNEFIATMDRIQNGFFALVYIDRLYEEAGRRKVWLEWNQIYGVSPKMKDRDAVKAHIGD